MNQRRRDGLNLGHLTERLFGLRILLVNPQRGPTVERPERPLPSPASDPRRSGPYSGRDERNNSAAQAAQHATVRERREIAQLPCFHVQPLRPLPDAPAPCVASGGASISRTGRIAGRMAAPASSRSTRSPGRPAARSAGTFSGPTDPSGDAYSGATISIGSPTLENSKFVVPVTSTPVGSFAENAVFARTGVPSSSIQMSNASYCQVPPAAGAYGMARLAVKWWSFWPSTSSGPT